MSASVFEVPERWGWENKGVDDALQDVNLLDAEQDGAFLTGAAWMAGGLAVCEFLSDLAEIVAEAAACPVCDAGWVRPNTFGGMDRLCHACGGTGKRVTP